MPGAPSTRAPIGWAGGDPPGGRGCVRRAGRAGGISLHGRCAVAPGHRHHQPGRASPAESGRKAGPCCSRCGQYHAGLRRGRELRRPHRRLLAGPATAFGPIAAVLRSAGFAAVNLETAITGGGTPQPKTYHFRAPPAAFTALRDAGINLVTMANNHVLDYGPAGLAGTLAAARATRFPYVGIGTSAAAAWAPYVRTINGVRFAVIGVSQVAELASSWVATPGRPGEANAIDLPRTLAAVRAARRLAPIVIVFMHWGTEGQACPDQAQLALAPKLAAAGASIIIGAHAHMLQGSGWLGHTFIAYGLGNFLWWSAPTAPPPACWNSPSTRTPH